MSLFTLLIFLLFLILVAGLNGAGRAFSLLITLLAFLGFEGLLFRNIRLKRNEAMIKIMELMNDENSKVYEQRRAIFKASFGIVEIDIS